jgi:hypothetical protein
MLHKGTAGFHRVGRFGVPRQIRRERTPAGAVFVGRLFKPQTAAPVAKLVDARDLKLHAPSADHLILSRKCHFS